MIPHWLELNTPTLHICKKVYFWSILIKNITPNISLLPIGNAEEAETRLSQMFSSKSKKARSRHDKSVVVETEDTAPVVEPTTKFPVAINGMYVGNNIAGRVIAILFLYCDVIFENGNWWYGTVFLAESLTY